MGPALLLIDLFLCTFLEGNLLFQSVLFVVDLRARIYITPSDTQCDMPRHSHWSYSEHKSARFDSASVNSISSIPSPVYLRVSDQLNTCHLDAQLTNGCKLFS